jgi:hypothetical protein
MNLFILDENAVKAAQLQCDKHVSKMKVESKDCINILKGGYYGHLRNM